MFRVRVNKIESTRDLDGNLGKRIELLEERDISPYVVRPQSDEAKVAQDIMQALQTQMPFLPQRTQMATPKIILFLTEQEYDSLGTEFDVNQAYEVFLENQTIKFKKHFFVAFLVFSLSLAITAVVSPAVIASNSSNIFITAIGVMGYAVMIGCLPQLEIMRAGLVLHVLKFASSATVVVLAGLIALGESKLVPFLTAESLLKQNSRLIDNYTDADALAADLTFRLQFDQAAKIDLFYGEPSFLAIVIFTCLGCFMLTSKLLTYSSNGGGTYTYLKSSLKSQYLIILISIISLLYIQSFSSIIYALVATYFVFIKLRIRREKLLTLISWLIVIAIFFLLFSYEYFLYRITQTDSLSFIQRFGFLFDIGIGDLLFGIKDVSTLPGAGIHNGLFYIIAISGLGGILYLVSLLYSVYTLASPIKSSIFTILLVLAIMMQNGGVFSPSKVVLFSLVLLPLACARTIYSGLHSAVNARHYG